MATKVLGISRDGRVKVSQAHQENSLRTCVNLLEVAVVQWQPHRRICVAVQQEVKYRRKRMWIEESHAMEFRTESIE